MAAKIVIITSGQPSLNPRLVKEADTLTQHGYDVLVIYAYWNHWATKTDEQLLASKKWKAVRAAGHPDQNAVTYFISRVIFRVAAALAKKFRLRYFADAAVARASYFLQAEAKKHHADLYIGHNLGALPATVKAAKKHQKPCGFDAEDFHRKEVTDDETDADVILKTWVEDRYIPQVNYLTAGSPQIAAAYRQLYPLSKPQTLLNVFNKMTLTAGNDKNDATPIKLFWFSQTVGPGRGLENVIESLSMLDGGFELHLLGYCDNRFKQQLRDPGYLHFHAPVHPDELPFFASQFDIGLATETSTPYNRDICLTNKIFTYMQAGLAVVASDTTAQTALLSTYPAVGKLYQNTAPRSLADVLLFYQQNRQALKEAKKASIGAAHEYLNWETESKKFLTIIKKTITA
ncbi:glycosyltransferase family 4 protein [Mucilaginibacter sp. 14171R-50]|uniref:glycosyltransferase family 4 protein n=1 Tax=Mucilaginibacter sp. 14171R-50 TaxID=2703789 RepID=UPI00138D8D63|nr:glycosyltransferase family 4 protein [Mucilaginibacter sp. 14171R-50]QHS56331.1 glycosyltransferase family 4 protein [Mucilaginibacter sp. 14171R-50]